MPDQTKYVFKFYHDGVSFTAKVRGKDRYLREKAFLDQLTGQFPGPESASRPIPDPATDCYLLDDQQLAAYSAFRMENARAERQGE